MTLILVRHSGRPCTSSNRPIVLAELMSRVGWSVLLISVLMLHAEAASGATPGSSLPVSETIANWTPLKEVAYRADTKITEFYAAEVQTTQWDRIDYSLNLAGYTQSPLSAGDLQYPRIWNAADSQYSQALTADDTIFERLDISRTEPGATPLATPEQAEELRRIMSSWRAQYAADAASAAPRMAPINSEIGGDNALNLFENLSHDVGGDEDDREVFLLWKRTIDAANGKVEKRLLAISWVETVGDTADIELGLANPETQILRATRDDGSIGAVGSSLRSFTMRELGGRLKSGALKRVTDSVLNRRLDADLERYGFKKESGFASCFSF